MRRRSFLGLAAMTGLTASGCELGPSRNAGNAGNAGTLRFSNRLRIPPLAEPATGADGVKRFTLTLRPGRTELLPGRAAATWGVNGAYLGPTLRATRGDQVAMQVTNHLGETTTLHWHGMRLPAVMDGGPHQPIEPGATWTPYWTIDQPAATGWYHPHPHGATALHIYRGLAGLFLLDDGHSRTLGLPNRYGVDDIPLIVQDKNLSGDGALVERNSPGWGATFGLLGDRILVNGTYDPFLAVTTTRVRFRILNASNARTYHLGFTDRRELQVIATDGGLLPAPVTVDRVQLSPAERAEIVVEFKPGERALLHSFAGDQTIDGGEFDILQIRAAGRLPPAPRLPERLSDTPPIQPPAGARVRTFQLSGTARINGKELDMTRIDEVVPAGAREVWEIDNIVFAHSFHIHEVAFRILDVGGRPPPAWLRGPKDTVFVPGNTKVRLAVQFGRYTNPRVPYMFHCHILFHEDKGMMGQYVVVEPGTEPQVSRTLPAAGHDHG